MYVFKDALVFALVSNVAEQKLKIAEEVTPVTDSFTRTLSTLGNVATLLP